MESIDPEHLYDERSDVARSRPIFQGDVFKESFYRASETSPALCR